MISFRIINISNKIIIIMFNFDATIHKMEIKVCKLSIKLTNLAHPPIMNIYFAEIILIIQVIIYLFIITFT